MWTRQPRTLAFIHRFGSSLNEHVYFHVCVVDGVFETMAGEAGAGMQGIAPSVMFYPTTGMDSEEAAQVSLRRRILRAVVGRGLLKCFEAHEMLGYQHSGFSVDTSVCIDAPGWSACCTTVRAHRLRWIGCTSRTASSSTAAPSQALRPMNCTSLGWS